MIELTANTTSESAARWKLTAVAALTALMVLLLELHVRGIKGPWYSPMTWRRYPAMQSYGLILWCAAPAIFAVAIASKTKRWPALLLILPMIGAMAAKLVFAELRSSGPMHISFIADAVENPYATSYYTDAVGLSGFHNWLADFPAIMPILNLHSQTKAPGMILYYLAFIKMLGHSDRTAWIAGLGIGAISTLAIPVCYWFLLTLLEDRKAAFLGACFLALCPGFVLFFPASDPAYAILSCVLGVCWIKTLKQDSIAWSIATGLMLAVILVISFNVLVMGLFLAGYAWLATDRSVLTIVKKGAIALACCLVLCIALWLMTGYNPIATFISAWQNQHTLLAQHPGQRPYPSTIWNDLSTFALASGWISYLLTGFCIASCIRTGWNNRRTRIVLLVVGQLLFIAISALLASETERVWNFLLPLLIAPIGMELAKWRPSARAGAFLCLAILMAADCRNLSIFM